MVEDMAAAAAQQLPQPSSEPPRRQAQLQQAASQGCDSVRMLLVGAGGMQPAVQVG
jgi:hypothetical protein